MQENMIHRLRAHWVRNISAYADIVEDFQESASNDAGLRSENNLQIVQDLQQSQRNLLILVRRAEIILKSDRNLNLLLEAVQEYHDDLLASDEKAATLLVRIRESLKMD